MSSTSLDLALTVGSIAVVAVQLLVPMTFGLREVIRHSRDDAPSSSSSAASRKGLGKLLRRKVKEATAAAPVAPLVPLACVQCKAPVPLDASTCPYCKASVTAPPEYQDAIAKRAEAEVTLARAEKAWRWSRVTSSPLLLWPARFGIVLWVAAVVFACTVLGGDNSPVPSAVLFLPAILAVLQIFIGFAVVSVFADWKKALPPLPKIAPRDIPAELGACRGCKAPLAFAAGRLASTCGYCTAVTYRAAVAAAEHDKARAGAGAAASSLVEAVRARDERKSELGGMLALMFIAEIFYGVLALLMFIGDLLGL